MPAKLLSVNKDLLKEKLVRLVIPEKNLYFRGNWLGQYFRKKLVLPGKLVGSVLPEKLVFPEKLVRLVLPVKTCTSGETGQASTSGKNLYFRRNRLD